MLALVVAYFFLPYDVRSWFPVWLLFLAALGLEVDFFVGGWLQARQGVRPWPPRRRTAARSGAICPSSGAGTTGIRAEPTPPIVADPGFSRLPRGRGGRPRLAIVAVILYFAVRPSGWDAVSSKRQAQTETILSREASLIARHPATVTCDTSGEHVGFVQDADGLRRSRRRSGVPDARRSATRSTSSRSSTGCSRSRARRARSRCSAHESWHLRGVRERGPGELLRLPERRRRSASTSASREAARGR